MPTTAATNHSEDWLSGQGEMVRLIRSHDWSRTAVGPPETWPQSLKTALSICLGSKFPMFVWWGEDLTVFYNDAYIPFTGLKHPTYLGRPAREQWAEIWDELMPLIQHVQTTGEATWAESMQLFMTRKGFLEETYFTFSYSPVHGEKGEVAGIINPCQETTERVLSERRLKTLHELGKEGIKSVANAGEVVSKALANNVYDVPFALVYYAGLDGKTATRIGIMGLSENSSLAPQTLELSLSEPDPWHADRVLRYGQAEFINGLRTRHFQDLPATPYEEKPDAAYVLPIESPGQNAAIGFIVLRMSPRLAFNEGYREFFSLITKQIATQISNARAIEEEKKRVVALAEIDRTKTAFFSNVSHEFRTPLTLMLSPLEDLLSNTTTPLSPEIREEIEAIHRNGLRLLKMVNALLDFSRTESDRTQTFFAPTDLAQLTQDLASTFRSVINKAGLKLVVDCPTLSEPAYVDRGMWEKIVLNLISNAFKFTFEGQIAVKLRETVNSFDLRISDTGTGIPEEELPKIFTRFHRIPTAKSRTFEGTGIGLALVRELVKIHGGHISVESTPGNGTTMKIVLPKGSAHLPAAAVSQSPAAETHSSTGTLFVKEAQGWLAEENHGAIQTSGTNGKLPDKTILVVDDNPDLRHYLAGLIGAYYHVRTANDGREALDAICQHPPDLVLSDAMMPNMDGFELLREIRSRAEIRALPFILLSAKAGEESAVEGLKEGADDYLTKPFSSKELLSRISNCLDRVSSRQEWARETERATQLANQAALKQEFMSIVAHELRTPLAVIQENINLAMEDPANKMTPSLTECLEMAQRNITRLSRLVRNVLDYNKYQSDRFELRVQPVSVCDLVHIVAKDFAGSASNKGVTVKLDCADDMSAVKCDPDGISQVVVNLLTNAIKFAAKEVRINTYRKNGSLVVEVSDDGPGIGQDDAPKLFRAFGQINASDKRQPGGTGLGLMISKIIVEKHRGSIGLKRSSQPGTTFYFEIPV